MDHSVKLRPEWNAAISPNTYGRLFIDNQDQTPGSITPVSITRRDGQNPVYRMWGAPASGAATSFETSLMANRNYAIGFHGDTPHKLRVTLRFCQPGDWITVTLPAPATHITVFQDTRYQVALTPLSSLSNLSNLYKSGYCLIGNSLTLKLYVPNLPGRDTAYLTVFS